MKLEQNDSDQQLNGLDTLFLKCEHPRRLMTVSSLWTFKHCLDAKKVYEVLDKLCQSYPRFARVPRHESFLETAHWTVPMGWSPEDNLVLHTLVEPTKASLQEYCSLQVAQPFDYTKPLWELHAISGLQGDQCALFWKAHHSISDGQGFIRALLSTTSLDNSLKLLETKIPHRHSKRRKSSNLNKIPKPIRDIVPDYITAFILWVWNFLYQARLVWISFYHDLYCSVLSGFPASRKDLNYPELQSFEKQMAWSEDIRMQDISLVRQVFGGTLNDVMLTVITRCVKHYLENNSTRHDDYLNFIIPISLRKSNDWSCRNVVSGSWGFFSMKDLDTKHLINQVRTEMLAIKNSYMTRILYDWVELIWGRVPGLTPPVSLYNHICDISHGVFTNVPGPTQPITFAGQQIQEYRTFPPQSGKGSIGIALVSYNGNVSIGAITDMHRKYPDLADGICGRFKAEFKFILDEAKMELSKKEY